MRNLGDGRLAPKFVKSPKKLQTMRGETSFTQSKKARRQKIEGRGSKLKGVKNYFALMCEIVFRSGVSSLYFWLPSFAFMLPSVFSV